MRSRIHAHAHAHAALALLALAALAASAALLACERAPKPPPVLLTVPSFALTDQAGARFADDRLAGGPWVANFIFTRCPDVCPVFTARMAELQTRTAKLAAPPRLVSFSVDPEHDTPAKLAAYAHAHGADPARWSFLTGPTDEVRVAVEGGLRVNMGNNTGTASAPVIGHGQHFVLVDGRRRIRGYYDMEDPKSLDKILVDLRGLAAEKK